MEKKSVNIEKNFTGGYLTAIIASLVVGVGGLSLILFIRPDYDPLLVAGIIFAFLTPTTTSLLSFIQAKEAKEQAKETHLAVNSRLDQFIKQATLVAKAEGVDEGRKDANARTDLLATEVHLPTDTPKQAAVGTITGEITSGTITGTVSETKE